MTFGYVGHMNKIYNKPLLYRQSNIYAIANPLNGLEIGIPLNIFSNIYTNLHYGYDITNIKTILLQFLFGYYAYGNDRLKDALEYNENRYETTKEDLYNIIINNKEIYDITINLTFLCIGYILLNDENYIYNFPFIPLLYTSKYYKQLKKKISILKPLYISFMWTIAAVILPCVLHDHDYSIIKYPLDYLPCMLTLFATSNLADNKDVEEDKINNIETIPVKFGKNISNIMSLSAMIISSLLFIENSNFINRPIINSLIEIQNFGIIGLLYNNTFIN